MHTVNIVAVFPSRSEAEQARDRLADIGVAHNRVRLSDSNYQENGQSSAKDEGFFSWLFGSSVDEQDRSFYNSTMTGGRTAVSILAEDTDRGRIESVLEGLSPIDLEEQTSTTDRDIQGLKGSALPSEAAEQVIPVVEEQLDVGKKTIERRHRIRTRVIEQPIEQAINLREERVVIERRPVANATSGEQLEPGEKEIEIVERHEEPVVAKTARTTEEIVVRKEQSEHQETVRDTVRRTEVDVDAGASRNKPR